MNIADSRTMWTRLSGELQNVRVKKVEEINNCIPAEDRNHCFMFNIPLESVIKSAIAYPAFVMLNPPSTTITCPVT